jgi:non-canonical poly(A) RNA polymerase PAPD5/7
MLTSSPIQSKVRNFPYKSYDRLSIIDPNNRTNDISGGSFNFESVTRGFRQALDTLRRRMGELAGQEPAERADASILEAVLGGNYENFDRQREYLRRLHEKTVGPCDDAAFVC